MKHIVDSKYVRVTKHDRAGRKGKWLFCPHCNQHWLCYHFSWFAVECQKCKFMVEKTSWYKTVPRSR